MACLSEVFGILDLDGFTIEKKFYCKELSIIKVGDVAARSYFCIVYWSKMAGFISEGYKNV